jgi:hypothetical protein
MTKAELEVSTFNRYEITPDAHKYTPATREARKLYGC